MKHFFFAVAAYCTILIIQISPAKAQCTPGNITISTSNYWPFTWNNNAADNNDIAWDITPIDDGDEGTEKDNGFVVVGETYRSSTNRLDAVVMRINPDVSPNPYWKRYFGGTMNDVAYAVEQNSDNHIIVVGTKVSTAIASPMNSNVWMVELDVDGNQIGSEHEYGSSGHDAGYDFIEDGDYYVVAGETGDYTHIDHDLLVGPDAEVNAGGDYWVVKINKSDFSINWQRSFHGDHSGSTNTNYSDFARGITKSNSGNYVVTGYCESCESNQQMQQALLVKINPSTGNGASDDFGDEDSYYERDQGCHKIIETHEGSSYYFLGVGVAHPDYCFGDEESHDVYFVKTATNFVNIWSGDCLLDQGMDYGGDRPDNGYDVIYTPCDGGYLIVGSEASKADDVECNNACSVCYTSDAWLVKVDASGAIQWEESVGDDYNDEAHSIRELSDGSYVFAGEIGTDLNGSVEGQNFFVVKFDITDCEKTEETLIHAIEDFSIYPNPSSGRINITLELPEKIDGIATIQISNPTGTDIFIGKLPVENGLTNQQLNVTNLLSGFYWVRVTVNAISYHSKLIIQ